MFDMEKWNALSFDFMVGDFSFQKEAGTTEYLTDDVMCEVGETDTISQAQASLIIAYVGK